MLIIIVKNSRVCFAMQVFLLQIAGNVKCIFMLMLIAENCNSANKCVFKTKWNIILRIFAWHPKTNKAVLLFLDQSIYIMKNLISSDHLFYDVVSCERVSVRLSWCCMSLLQKIIKQIFLLKEINTPNYYFLYIHKNDSYL